MKKRSKEILDLLGRRENDHTISTLAAKFEVSERTIRNDIKDINDYLKEQEIKPIRFGSNGLIVMEEDISQARETTQQEDLPPKDPVLLNRTPDQWFPCQRPSLPYQILSLKEY